MMHVHQAGSGQLMTASGQVGQPANTNLTPGVILQKIICNASTSALIRVRNGQTVAGSIVVDSFALTAGQIYDMNLGLGGGCYIELVSGTGSWTAVSL